MTDPSQSARDALKEIYNLAGHASICLVEGETGHVKTALIDILERVDAALAAQPQAEPIYWYAECADPDYSRLYHHEGDAKAQISDHGGGTVTPLYTHPAPQAEPSSATVPSDAHLIKLSQMLWEQGHISDLSRDTAVIFARAVLALAAPAELDEQTVVSWLEKQGKILVSRQDYLAALAAPAVQAEPKTHDELKAWLADPDNYQPKQPAAQSADAVTAANRYAERYHVSIKANHVETFLAGVHHASAEPAAQSADAVDDRETFEAFVSVNEFSIDRAECSDYRNSATRWMWMGWMERARRAAISQSAAAAKEAKE